MMSFPQEEWGGDAIGEGGLSSLIELVLDGTIPDGIASRRGDSCGVIESVTGEASF